MDRRRFLTGTAAALAAAGCGSGDGGTGVSVQPPTTQNGPPRTTRAAPSVDPAEPPGVDLGDNVFGLGVASGDPDDHSVVIWTRLLPNDIGASVEIPLAWDVADDAGFQRIIGSAIVSARVEDALTVRVVVAGLDPDRRYWYRFRIADRVSPTGRTRTLPSVGQGVDRVGLAVSSCQARDDLSLWDGHLRLASDEAVDLVIWLGDFIYDQNAANLQEFRARYAEARGDSRLQASAAAHPWLVTWDDHEVVDNYDASVDPGLRSAGYRAWWEHTPTRLPPPGADGLTIYRHVDIGDTARILLLDCRQYQTDATVLGPDQIEWFTEAANHGARHTVIASPVVMTSFGFTDLAPRYAFEAHPSDQAAVRAALAAAPNPTIVSGDLHAAMELRFAPGVIEWMAPPLSSTLPAELAGALRLLPLVSDSVVSVEVIHGYLRLEIDGSGVAASFA